jgi:hypothetical protein
MDKNIFLLLSKVLDSIPSTSGVSVAFGLGQANDAAFLAIRHIDGTSQFKPVPEGSRAWLKKIFLLILSGYAGHRMEITRLVSTDFLFFKMLR